MATDTNPGAVNAINLSATNSFIITINALYGTPVLPAQNNRTIDEATTLTVTNTAIDGNIPSLGLDYMLVNAPVGATINSNGVITWTPTEAQGPSTNQIVPVVTDRGAPRRRAKGRKKLTVSDELKGKRTRKTR